MPKLSFLSGRAFDAGLAALAALSAGFVAFAMPDPLFSGLVEASRPPDFVAGRPAAAGRDGAARGDRRRGPAHLRRRLGADGAARPGAGARARPEAEPEAEAPRLRRADAHPDAPARRPLLARDLGEPLDLEDFPEAPAEEEPASPRPTHRPLPGFLVPQEPEAGAGRRKPRPEPWSRTGTSWPSRSRAEPEPEPEPERKPSPCRSPSSPHSCRRPKRNPTSRCRSWSTGSNSGCRASARRCPPRRPAAGARKSPVEQEKVGHRLRSAINDLQKIASSGG